MSSLPDRLAPQRQPREWDARTYDRLPLPHLRWGDDLLARLDLRGDETVLDAGAGTGRDTAKLLARLPRGRVIAVDGSRAMLDRLAARFAGHPDASRLTVLHADLTRPLPVDVQVDVVFSVATFHWLPDHPALFAHLASVLRPRGRLHAEWGGHGNIAAVEQALADLGLPPLGGAVNFATAEQTRGRLLQAGFAEPQVTLGPDPARLQPGEQLETFLATVVLGALLDQVPLERHREVVRNVAARLPAGEIDYVRLHASATRS
jgi:trans-aconitate 2-methyltransferase